MLRGYRSIIAAIAGLIFLGASPPQKNGENPSQNSSDQIGPALQDVAASLREANKASNLEKPCQKGENARTSDLCAQWKAADAAKSAADAAWTFGLLGTLIGSLTLAAAWSAAKWARSAAHETKRGADAAERDLESNRAWFTFKNVEVRQIHLPPDEAGNREVSVSFNVYWENSGGSPGLNVQLWTGMRPTKEDMEKLRYGAIEPFAPGKPEGSTTGVAGQGFTYSSSTYALTPDMAAEFFSGELGVIVYSRITYRDIYASTPDRHTEATIFICIDSMQFGPNGEKTPNVYMMPVGHQNTAS